MNPSPKTQRVILAVVSSASLAAVSAALGMPSQATTATGPDPARAVGFYDSTLQRVVVVSGSGQPMPGTRDRVWSWSGREWEPVSDLGPSARSLGAAAYDIGRRAAIVNGGVQRSATGTGAETLGDTWAGSATDWRPLTDAQLEPRDHHAMVYDGARRALLLFGGVPGNRVLQWPSDTWELRRDGWVRVATEGPPGRARTALAYDTRRRQVVLFGGVGAPTAPNGPQPFFGDTWIWNGSRWRRAADEGPRARYAHGMVFDEAGGVVLLYSGAAAHRDAPLSDMWTWDGRRWTEIVLSGPTPGHRYQPVMVYDRARRRTVLYGGVGSTGDTWEWDGRQWKAVSSR